jgi:hypothetical protein
VVRRGVAGELPLDDRIRQQQREQYADDVVLGPPRTRELCVLLLDQDQQMQPDQRQEDAGDQQHVHDVEATDDQFTDVVAAEEGPVRPRADHRDGQQDRRHDAQTGAGEQVVRQGVAGEALADGQEEQHHADQPVGLPRPAEGAGEEDAHQVHDDRGDEHQRGPVVDLADEQTAADVERQIQRRVVGGRHDHAAQRCVRALVGNLAHRGVEEERQVRAREQQDDERVERDLPEQERPVVGEHLVQRAPQPGGDEEPFVDLDGSLADLGLGGAGRECGSHQMRSRFQ